MWRIYWECTVKFDYFLPRSKTKVTLSSGILRVTTSAKGKTAVLTIIVLKMDEEIAVEEIVTKFLLNTCRLRRQLSWPAVHATMQCVYAATARPPDDKEAHWIPLTTGSVAEFYIEPMLLHIGDIDVMAHISCQLAIPQGQSPPTQLPAEFENYVQVFDIIDSHLPGYVYLELRYLLTECSDNSKYNAVECDRALFVTFSTC